MIDLYYLINEYEKAKTETDKREIETKIKRYHQNNMMIEARCGISTPPNVLIEIEDAVAFIDLIEISNSIMESDRTIVWRQE